MDEGEWLLSAIKRELMEETGLSAETFHLVNVVHQIQNKTEHWVQFGFEADDWNGTVQLVEPAVCFGWDWFAINRLPKPMFPAHLKHIEQWRNYTSVLQEEEIYL